MSAHDHADPSDRARIAEEDRFLAGLVGEYAAAAAASPPCARPPRTAKLRAVLALYEAFVVDDPSR
jgi:hypothetical protein